MQRDFLRWIWSSAYEGRKRRPKSRLLIFFCPRIGEGETGSGDARLQAGPAEIEVRGGAALFGSVSGSVRVERERKDLEVTGYLTFEM